MNYIHVHTETIAGYSNMYTLNVGLNCLPKLIKIR